MQNINSLNTKKSSDIYGMSATFLKILSSSVSETLSTLYDESFSQGIFPKHKKHAMVTPVQKRGFQFGYDKLQANICFTNL